MKIAGKGFLRWLLPKKSENWRIVLFCVFTAFTFWLFNALNKNYTTVIDYPILFTFGEDSLILIEELPKEIKVDVSGRGWNLFRRSFWYGKNPIKIALDNPAQTKFISKSTLQKLAAEQIEEFKLNYVLTDTIFIRIDREDFRFIHLRVDSSKIDFANQYHIASPIRISDPVVKVVGAESRLSELPDTLTVFIPENTIDENIDLNITLNEFTDKQIEFEPVQVNIQFEVDRWEVFTRQVSVVPVNFPESRETQLLDSLVEIQVKVGERYLPLPDSCEFVLVADYNKLHSDSSIQVEIIHYPDYIDAIELTQPHVKIRAQSND